METEISPELVEQLMQAALMSPASKSSNPWQFVLVDDREMLEALSVSKKSGAKLIENCSLAVVVIADPEKSDVWVEDASIASIYLQLEAEDLGLGSCWVQIRCRQDAEGEDSEEVVKHLLDIPSNFRVESIIAIGMKEVSKEPHDMDNLPWEKVHLGKFKPTE
jgi:nitroreductase